MKIGCAVPTHNRADLLPYTLRSIQKQTVPMHKVVVVSDGCTDNTKNIVADFIEQYPYDMQFMQLEKQEYMSQVMATGMNQLQDCDYVFILASDDFLPHTFNARTLATFRLKKADFVYPRTLVHFESNREKNGMPIVEKREDVHFAELDPNTMKKIMLERNIIAGSTVYCNKMYQTLGGYAPLDIYDYHFNLKMVLRGYKGAMSDTHIFYRQHAVQESRKRSMEQRQQAFKIIFEDLEANGYL